MSDTELSVVCKSCGSEVSPYVTECPYCGTRLRKRAPKLERVGDEVRVREDRRTRRRRKAAERRGRLAERTALTRGPRPRAPVITVAAIVVPALLMVVERATNLSVIDLGAIVGPVGDEWWRYLAAPFVYDDVGYLFACGLAIAIFLPGGRAPRRLASPPCCVVLGCRRARDARRRRPRLDLRRRDLRRRRRQRDRARRPRGLVRDPRRRAPRRPDRRVRPDRRHRRRRGPPAAAAVEDFASVWAGLAGALVGAGCGLGAALGRR